MTLKLHKVLSSLGELARNAVDRVKAGEQEFPYAAADFEAACQKLDLNEMAKSALEDGWNGAMLAGEEPLSHIKGCPAMPKAALLVAVDGSQVYPDRHAAALYYAINIGYFQLDYATGACEADAEPSLHYEEEELLLEGNPIPNAVLNARRSVQEMLLLQKKIFQSRKTSPDAASVALLDGTIALRVQEESFPSAERSNLQAAYFAAIKAFAAGKIPFAGYIARPGGTPVLSLAALGAGKPASPGTSSHKYATLTDRMFFERRLKHGERSALFLYATYWNTNYRKAAGSEPDQGVCFFYLNVSRGAPIVARVEIPAWVAGEPALVDRIHAILVEQCSVTLNDPYPYALIRADEEAFVSGDEKAYLEKQLSAALIRSGLPSFRSEKLEHKGRARRK